MALGNAGSARALPVIARFIAHPSPLLRASAAAALRWIDAAPVDGWLVRCLVSDPDATVRQEAAAALGFREPTAETIAAQQRAFRAEPVDGIRLAILSNLGRARRAFPELQEFIRKAAASDGSTNVRKAAASLVALSP
jgi:HEAT repeat protein